MSKKIIFTGGGTGGHIIPLLNLKTYLDEQDGDYSYMWLGERNSLEETMAKDHDIEFYDISAGKIRRHFDIRNFYEPLKNLTGIVEALYYLLRYKGDIIFSKGGYVSLPVIIAGFILRKKIYIHESDSVTGLANVIGSKFATKVFYTSQESQKAKEITSGPIMNPLMLDEIKTVSKAENEKLNVLVIGGSQGSENIFKSVLRLLPDSPDIDFHIVLGTNTNEKLHESLRKFSNAHIYNFLQYKELTRLYVQSDIAISRGSSLLWELYFFGIHTIIIPLRYTGRNHQRHNAVYFAEKFGSDMINESETLHKDLYKLLQKYKYLRKTGLNLEGFLDGLKIISKELENS